MTVQVKIKSSKYYSNNVVGTFDLAQKYTNSTYSSREGFIWILRGDKKIKLHVNKKDFEVLTSDSKKSDVELNREIEDRFNVMETLVDGVLSRNIKSMIISGAPGIGKSFTVDEKLLKAKNEGKINYSQLTGSCTPIGLYLQLWNHQNHNDVLVLDDIDSIFQDQESLNLLKGALDTGRTRQISWMSASSFLRDEGIDNTFEFNGTVIFITNMNFDQMIAKATKMSPHFAALISRCVYLDLGIHTTREVMIRINQVIRNTNILRDLGVGMDSADEIVAWMFKHKDTVRSLSIRTLLQLASFIKTDAKNWKVIAEAVMVKR